jgi:hypothetical protein
VVEWVPFFSLDWTDGLSVDSWFDFWVLYVGDLLVFFPS